MKTKFILTFLVLLITSCKDDIPNNENLNTSNTLNECAITQFKFRAEENPEILINDLTAEIQDSIISIHIPHIVDSKILKPTFSYIGDTIFSKDTKMNTSTSQNPLNVLSPIMMETKKLIQW